MSRPVASRIQFAVAAAATVAVMASSHVLAHETHADAADVAGAMPASQGLNSIPADDLKRDYMACERAAMAGQLDAATVMACSMLYEELRARVFGGSFEALLSWWRGATGVIAENR